VVEPTEALVPRGRVDVVALPLREHMAAGVQPRHGVVRLAVAVLGVAHVTVAADQHGRQNPASAAPLRLNIS
jgi:hypothetical protein